MRVLRGLVGAVEQAGISPAALLEGANVDLEELETADASLPCSELHRTIERALDLTADPALGLHWALRLSEKTFSPVSYLVAHAATLRQGLQSLLQFHRLISHHQSFSLSEAGDKVTLRYAGSSSTERVERFCSEMLTVSVVRILRNFDPRARPDLISFAYPAPAYRDEYARAFDHTERFAQPFTGVVFDRALLDAPSPHRDSDLHNALKVIAERRMSRLTRSEPFAPRVRALVLERGTTESVDMESIARTLGVSKRSLRRRLVSEGTSYNAVVNDALAVVAKQLLRHRGLSIQEAAFEMGFAATSTFHRAFKRWTGMTPNTFRQAH
jgi:AraC-like DNA-binding protein